MELSTFRLSAENLHRIVVAHLSHPPFGGVGGSLVEFISSRLVRGYGHVLYEASLRIAIVALCGTGLVCLTRKCNVGSEGSAEMLSMQGERSDSIPFQLHGHGNATRFQPAQAFLLFFKHTHAHILTRTNN